MTTRRERADHVELEMQMGDVAQAIAERLDAAGCTCTPPEIELDVIERLGQRPLIRPSVRHDLGCPLMTRGTPGD